MISRLIGSLDSIDISESSMTKDILVSKHSTTKQVSDWLGREGFLLAQEKLTGINGKQLFALSKDELKEIVGFGEGVKLYSKLLREKDLLPSEYKTMNENDLERLLRLRREDIDSKTSENPTTTFGGRENENSNFFIKNIFSPSDLKPERYAEKVKRKPVFPIEFTKSPNLRKETSNTSHKTSELTQTKEKSHDKLKDSLEKSRDREIETSRDRSKLKSREKPSKQDSKSKESSKKKTKKSKKNTKLSSESENSDNLSDSADSIYSSNDSSGEKKRKSPSKQKKNKKKTTKSSKSSKTIAQMSTSTSTQENQNFINHPFFQSAPTPQARTMTHPFVRPITFPAYSPSSFLAPPLATSVNTPFIPTPPTYPYYGPNVLQQPWIGYGNSRYL